MSSFDGKTPVVIVAGIGKNTRSIGKNDQLLFHVPEDLKRFKKLTLGKPVIMGRKTFESIFKMLGKPLPNRTNIVVTSDTEYKKEGVHVAHSLEEAFRIAESENPTEIHIGGGAQLYEQSLPYVDKLFLTLFDSDKEGDTLFPEYEKDFMEVKKNGPHEYNGLEFEWVDYVRK